MNLLTAKMPNQLVKVDFSDASKWKCYSGTATFSNNEVSVVGAVGRNGIILASESDYLDLVEGHKYYISLDYKSTVTIQTYICSPSIFLQATNSWANYSNITTRGSGLYYRNMDTFPRIKEQVGDFSLRNIMCIDLTELYGAGHEPTTVEQFKADYPLDYYKYSPTSYTGLLMHNGKLVGAGE